MMIDRKLAEWLDAGLIDSETAARIARHEQEEHTGHTPRLLWAVAALGLFAVALGLALLVSANWDQIPAALKLSVHALLLLAAALASWPGLFRLALWGREAALFLFSALVLAGIVLQAQIFQLPLETWGILLLWMALSGPALFLGGKTRLTGVTLGLGLIAAFAVFAADTGGRQGVWLLAQGGAIALPAVLVLLSCFRGLATANVRQTLRQLGFATILLGVSLAHFVWANHVSPADAREMLSRLLPVAMATLAAILLGKQHKILPLPLLLTLLLGPFLALFLATATPHAGDTFSRAVGVFVYCAMWGAIVWGAQKAGHNLLFAVAVGAIATRIFIVYLELFGSLAETGFTLLTGGGLLVLLAFGWRAIVQKAHVSR